MAEKHLKEMFNILIYQEMRIKGTLRFLSTPVRMAKVRNTSDSLCQQGCRARRTPSIAGGSANCTVSMETDREISTECWDLIYLNIQLYHSWA